MGSALFSETSISQKYLRRYPDSARARAWAGKIVHIETENGVWCIDAKGYTYAGRPEAWILPFEEAQAQISHCGPEKRGNFILAAGQTPPSIGPSVDVLYLHVRAIYFNEILDGKKLEEFRRVNDHWRKRLEGRSYKFVEIVCGYPSKHDTSLRIRFPWHGYVEKTLTHRHFGQDPVQVFAIKLSK